MGQLEREIEREIIFADALECNIHFMTLQETGCKSFKEFIGRSGRIINLRGNYKRISWAGILRV